MTASVADFPAPVGAQVSIERESGALAKGEVIGFRDQTTLLYLFSGAAGVRRGDHVRLERTTRTLRCGSALLGRVIDAHGRAIDGRPQPMLLGRVPLDREPPSPIERPCDSRATRQRRPRDRRHARLWPRPTAGHFLRFRRRQERAVGHDEPPHRRRRDRHRPDRRARPRSERIPRARLGPRWHGSQRGGRRHQQRAGADARSGRVHRDRRRRVLPRQGPARAAVDGLGHAVRHGATRDRSGGGRAADHARLSTFDVQPAAAIG